MGGQARSAAESAAKAIISRGQTQVPIWVQGIGGVNYNGLSPQLRPDWMTQQESGLFRQIGQGGLARARDLQGGVAGTAARLLNTGRADIDAAGVFNPEQQARTRFNRLQRTLRPERDRSRAGLEARLLAQGRLDSSGGAAQLGAQERAFSVADAQLLDAAYSEAQNQRNQGLQTARDIALTGTQVQGGLFAEGQQGVAGRRSQNDQLFKLLGISQNLNQAELNRLVAGSGALNNFNATQADGGGGGFGGALGGLVGGAAGLYFGGTEGGLAGYQAGSGIGAGLFGG